MCLPFPCNVEVNTITIHWGFNVIFLWWNKHNTCITKNCVHHYSFLLTVILLCAVDSALPQLMLAAKNMGMTKGDYVFMIMNLFPSIKLKQLWQKGNVSIQPELKAAYFPLLQVSQISTCNYDIKCNACVCSNVQINYACFNFSTTHVIGL